MFFLLSLSFSASCFELSRDFSSKHSYLLKTNNLTEQKKNIYGDNNFRSRLLSQYQKWRGTRYHFGGNSFRGIDCSALMQHLFRDTKNLSLPRTTREQILRGRDVMRHALQVGDLVFFRSGPEGRHVGVFIGNHEFIHASSSKGVIISTLKNKYWHSRFMTARRVTA